MKRTDFIKIIKLRSVWKISKKEGNYTLPNGEKLSTYLEKLVESQLEIDSLGILLNGEICSCSGGKWNKETSEFDDYILYPDFGENEICSYEQMEKRIKLMVHEILM